MVLCIYHDLLQFRKEVMFCIVEPDITELMKIAPDIFKIDPNENDYLHHPCDIDFYKSAREGLKKSPTNLSRKSTRVLPWQLLSKS